MAFVRRGISSGQVRRQAITQRRNRVLSRSRVWLPCSQRSRCAWPKVVRVRSCSSSQRRNATALRMAVRSPPSQAGTHDAAPPYPQGPYYHHP